MQINSTTLVSLGAKLAALSSNQAGLSSDDFFSMANLVMMSLMSEIVAAREEFLIYQESIPVVAGQSSYRIPYRAVNGTVRHLWFEDGSGTRTRLYGQDIEDCDGFTTQSTARPTGFYVMGNSLILLPTPNIAGSLVLAYPFRPNLLADVATATTVTAINYATNTITVALYPAAFGSGPVSLDIIDAKSGNGIIYYDQIGTRGGDEFTATITFPTAIPNIKVGNIVAPAGTSPLPMVPEEAHPLLLETVVMRIEMLRGNAARVKNSTAVIVDARKSFDALLNNRIVSKAHSAGSGGAQRPVRPY